LVSHKEIVAEARHGFNEEIIICGVKKNQPSGIFFVAISMPIWPVIRLRLKKSICPT
jgi:hypothetical protein